MITAIVRFKLPPTVKLEDAAEMFKGTAPKYRKLPGLVRKYYLYNGTPASVAASTCGRAGQPPSASIRPSGSRCWRSAMAPSPRSCYFDTPVVVDNTIDTISVAAAE